jgi:ComF family protein
MLVPVPLHWWRRWARGYNQSEAIAEGLSDSLGIPVRSGVLKRIRWTKKQAELSATQRYENIHGAFAIRDTEGIRGKRIALVDDVLTTGGTLSECARILRQAGAKWVGALVLAHR